ncbi:MAG: ATP-dependent DNA helicase [Solirubrobacterales bacterium]
MSDPLDQTTVAPGLPLPDQILEGLNDEQKAAVSHRGGPLMIVAGAGSGKTRTLTRRFQWLVADGVPVDRILALTYTNEAAGELAERIEQALGDLPDEIHATTFHSLCMEVLRDESGAAGLNPFFSVARDADRVAIMMNRLSEMTFEQISLRGNPAAALGDLCGVIDRLKEECVSPQQLADYAAAARADAIDEDAREKAALIAERARLYAQHDEFLRDAAALDFGGMQYELWKLLSTNEEVRKRVAKRFDHVLVDEFQDTTYVQLELLRLLSLDHGNLAAVGDDDQSIYGFRGASAGSILHFERRFGPATRVELELNYRSAAPIIDAARAIVRMIPDERRVPKELRAADDKQGEVLFWKGESEVAEVQAIVTEIERLIADMKVDPKQICVLARARSHMQLLADRLGAHGIPYQLAERDFFKRFEIRVPLSWLKVLANPTLNEDAWRMLTAHPINLDSADYAGVMRWMRRDKHPHVVDAMRTAARSKQFSPETLDKIRQFVTTFDALNAQLDQIGPGEFTIRLINEIAIKGSVLLEGGKDAPDRLANLSKFQRLAEEYESRSPGASAREFAGYITGMAEAGFSEESESAVREPDAVRLMTAHGSKGREFDYVFVPGMTSRRWPGNASSSKDVPDALVHDPLFRPDTKEEVREAHVEEIRRLAHVAMTRARKQLVLSWFDSDKRGHKVSEFFSEAMLAVGGEEQGFPERDFETADFVYAEMEALRDRLLASITEAGQDLGEMRLDAHAGTPADFARFAELIKLSALTNRLRHGQTIAGALPEVNAMLAGQMSPAQRAEFEASELDDRLRISEQRVEELGRALDAVTPQLSNYLPTIGNRLRLSASAIGSYQRCPKQYEYENVIKIPTPDQSHLRLGITVHNVLERFHKDLDGPVSPEEARSRLEKLLGQAVITGGWGRTDDERQLLARAKAMLDRYADSEFARVDGEVRTEVGFTLKLPPTELMQQTKVGGKILDGIQIGGKIDRIDTLADGTQRVVDYKTGHDKGGAVALKNFVAKEIQLAIYKFAGQSELGVDADQLTYYFLENEPGVEASATDEHVARCARRSTKSPTRSSRSTYPEPKPEVPLCASGMSAGPRLRVA